MTVVSHHTGVVGPLSFKAVGFSHFYFSSGTKRYNKNYNNNNNNKNNKNNNNNNNNINNNNNNNNNAGVKCDGEIVFC